jgi:hypothetical protein
LQIRRIKIKSITSIALIAFLIFLFFNFHQLSHQQEESSLILYVSPDGNDKNSGSLEAPLATFPGARDRVRLIKETAKNIFVYFREGEYFFDKTVILSNEDSGTESQKITFAAYGHEKPVFTSGKHISGWRKIKKNDPYYRFLPEKARDQIFVASIPKDAGMIRHLVDRNSDWLEPGKLNVTKLVTTPKYIHGESVEGQMWDPPEGKKVCTFSNSLEGLSNIDSALIFTIYTADFELQVLPVKKIEGSMLITATAGGHRLALPVEGQKHGSEELAFLHNLAEGIDEPGKWAFYPETGVLYLWPEQGADEIYAPALTELIRVEGVDEGRNAWFSTKKEKPVRNLIFDGITFTNGKQPVWQEGDMAAQHDWAMLDKDNALLRFRGAENCVVKNCIFEKSGGAGLAFDLYAKNNRIENNKFQFLGYEAIRLAGYGIGLKDDNKKNVVTGNEIHHVNEVHQYGAALVLWNTGFNSITDNYFHHFASRAILFSAPRSRAFTKNNQELFPPDRKMREQAWPMARWFEIPDSALATVYYAIEEEDGRELQIRRVEVNGYRQGSPGGLVADRTCSYFRFLRGNVVEKNVIAYGAEKLFADGIFYVTGCASGEPNKVKNNYIFNTGIGLPLPNIPFRLIYVDGYSGKFIFTQNFAYNCKFRFEVIAMYNWWDEVDSYANIFYDVQGEEYGKGNICIGYGENDPQKRNLEDYKTIAKFIDNYQFNYPGELPGRKKLSSELRKVIRSFSN